MILDEEVGPEDSQGKTWAEIICKNPQNKFIIYRFLNGGLDNLSDQELACALINQDFDIDFNYNTGKKWGQDYQSKVIELLKTYQYNLNWRLKPSAASNGLGTVQKFFELCKTNDVESVQKFFSTCNLTVQEIMDATDGVQMKTGLHIAVEQGQDEMVDYLIKRGARTDCRDKTLKTPLHLACLSGNIEIARILIQNQANLHQVDYSGFNCLHFACSVRQASRAIELINFLTDNNPDLLYKQDFFGRDPLLYSASMNHPDQTKIMEALFQLDSSIINNQDLDGKTALHFVAEQGNSRVCQYLIQKGANIQILDSYNRKPIDVAANEPLRRVIDGNYKFAIQQLLTEEVQKKDFSQQTYQKVVSDVKLTEQEWEEAQAQKLPKNFSMYQTKLVQYLKKVQQFGVDSFQHERKPYLFSGSWMEYVKSLDDLMLQLNGCSINEAILKIFNIMYPYRDVLYKLVGDETFLAKFYNSDQEPEKVPDCHPSKLKEYVENQSKPSAQKQPQVDVNDLMLKQQHMNVIQTQNHMAMVQLEFQLRMQNDQLQKQNSELNQRLTTLDIESRNQKQKIQEQNQLITKLQQEIYERPQQQTSGNHAELKAIERQLQLKIQKLQEQLNDANLIVKNERQRNIQLRIKAGKAFMQALEQNRQQESEPQYNFEDDNALLRLMSKISNQNLGTLQQLLESASNKQTNMITQVRFDRMLQSLETPCNDYLPLQRIVGFTQSKGSLSIDSVAKSFDQRRILRSNFERQILQQIATAVSKFKNMSLQSLFNEYDKSQSGYLDIDELILMIGDLGLNLDGQFIKSVMALFDHNGDQKIDLEEFKLVLSQYVKDQPKPVPVWQDHNFDYNDLNVIATRENQAIELIRSGSMPCSVIDGDMQLNILSSKNFPVLQQKNLYIKVKRVSYNDDGTKTKEKPLVKICSRHDSLTGQIDQKIPIPYAGRDKNRQADTITMEFYFKPNSMPNDEGAVFFGECFVPYKQCIQNKNQLQQFQLKLQDTLKRCKTVVKGTVNVEVKFSNKTATIQERLAIKMKNQVAKTQQEEELYAKQEQEDLDRLQQEEIEWQQNQQDLKSREIEEQLRKQELERSKLKEVEMKKQQEERNRKRQEDQAKLIQQRALEQQAEQQRLIIKQQEDQARLAQQKLEAERLKIEQQQAEELRNIKKKQEEDRIKQELDQAEIRRKQELQKNIEQIRIKAEKVAEMEKLREQEEDRIQKLQIQRQQEEQRNQEQLRFQAEKQQKLQQENKQKEISQETFQKNTEDDPEINQLWQKEWESLKQMCNQIVAKGQPWTDPDFGPNETSLTMQGEPILEQRWLSYKWKRASEVFNNYVLFDESINPDDIKQGQVGDCYFLSTISSVAEIPTRIRALFYNQQANSAGCYLIRFFVNGLVKGVMVDDHLLFDDHNMQVFCKSVNNEMWVPILEKAFAKLIGSYTRIDGAFQEYVAANFMVGTPGRSFDHKQQNQEQFWQDLKWYDKQECVMMATSQFAETSEFITADGIVSGHAYGLLSVHEIQIKDQMQKLIKLRNPWGEGEWKKEWQDNFEQWTPELMKQLDHTPGDDGKFLIPYENYLQAFCNTQVNCPYNPILYKNKQALVDFNKFPGLAVLQVNLAQDYNLKNEPFGISVYQQGDDRCRNHKRSFKLPMIQFLVFDSKDQIVLQHSSNYFVLSEFVNCDKTLAKGQYTIVVRPFWGMFEESSHTNPEKYRKVIVDLYYPRAAQFGQMQVLEQKIGIMPLIKWLTRLTKIQQANGISEKQQVGYEQQFRTQLDTQQLKLNLTFLVYENQNPKYNQKMQYTLNDEYVHFLVNDIHNATQADVVVCEGSQILDNPQGKMAAELYTSVDSERPNKTTSKFI